MSGIDGKQEKPINLVRLLVEQELLSVMKKMGVPDTETNREDMLALSLNSLPTKYVTTREGKQYAQLVEVYKAQYELDILTSLAKAGLKVLQKPRREEVSAEAPGEERN